MRYLTYAVLVFSVGCVDTGGTPAVPDGGDGSTANCPMPNAADIQAKVFSASCAFSSCHDNASRRADFDASSVAATCTSLKSNTPSCEFPSMARSAVLPVKLTCANFQNCTELGTPATSCTSAAGSNGRMPLGFPAIEQCKID